MHAKMGVVILWITILSSCINRNHESSFNNIKRGEIEFLDTIHHFDIIHKDNPIDSFDFKFVNTGESLLAVIDAKTSCNCTKIHFSREPIQPGDTSYIRVIYDGKGRNSEFFAKTVIVYTSASKEFVRLHINGQIQ
ncbi:MAG: DUF1573 domain-containing protein [Bacteroidaceae bacterium]|nr:DUF1573 domain-containing protein [Bacteroidaceae bacterium]